MNHAGVRTECVWMNFPADRLHWARCHTETRARFPDEMPAPLQYGPGVKSNPVPVTLNARPSNTGGDHIRISVA